MVARAPQVKRPFQDYPAEAGISWREKSITRSRCSRISFRRRNLITLRIGTSDLFALLGNSTDIKYGTGFIQPRRRLKVLYLVHRRPISFFRVCKIGGADLLFLSSFGKYFWFPDLFIFSLRIYYKIYSKMCHHCCWCKSRLPIVFEIQESFNKPVASIIKV